MRANDDLPLPGPPLITRSASPDRAAFTQWRSQYPAQVSFRVRRVTIRQDLAVVELSASYDGGPTKFGVALLDFRGDKK